MEKKIKFEVALKKLENIVEQLENDDIDLEKSFKIFEEGIKLSRLCSKQVEDTEKKIEMLLKDENGSKKIVPYEEK